MIFFTLPVNFHISSPTGHYIEVVADVSISSTESYKWDQLVKLVQVSGNDEWY